MEVPVEIEKIVEREQIIEREVWSFLITSLVCCTLFFG
jgi:hypothetical protein